MSGILIGYMAEVADGATLLAAENQDPGTTWGINIKSGETVWQQSQWNWFMNGLSMCGPGVAVVTPSQLSATPPPTSSEGRITLSTAVVLGYNATSGMLLWSTTLRQKPVNAGELFYIYDIASDAGVKNSHGTGIAAALGPTDVFGLDCSSGKMVWRHATPSGRGRFGTGVQAVDGLVAAPVNEGNVSVLDGATGRLRYNISWWCNSTSTANAPCGYPGTGEIVFPVGDAGNGILSWTVLERNQSHRLRSASGPWGSAVAVPTVLNPISGEVLAMANISNVGMSLTPQPAAVSVGRQGAIVVFSPDVTDPRFVALRYPFESWTFDEQTLRH
jgi:hypothetical protein